MYIYIYIYIYMYISRSYYAPPSWIKLFGAGRVARAAMCGLAPGRMPDRPA